MEDAELFIAAISRLYPTLYRTRIRCLDHILNGIGTGYAWVDGKMHFQGKIFYHKKWKETVQKVIKGDSKTIEDYYKEEQRKNARDYYEKTNQQVQDEDTFIKSDIERDAIGHQFYVYERSSPICHIPENVSKEWLNCCIELLQAMQNAKIDYNAESILTETQRKHSLQKTKTSLASKICSARILRKLAKEEGRKIKKTTKKQRQKEYEEWERVYSPRARAEHANNYNIQARKVANDVLLELKKRNLV